MVMLNDDILSGNIFFRMPKKNQRTHSWLCSQSCFCWCLSVTMYSGISTHSSDPDDVIKWKHFPRYWPFVRGIHRSQWFPAQTLVTQNFDVFFDLRLNKRSSKQSWGWWFETQSHPLCRRCYEKFCVPYICGTSTWKEKLYYHGMQMRVSKTPVIISPPAFVRD